MDGLLTPSLVGAAIIVVACVLALAMGTVGGSRVGRLVDWWLQRVVKPLLGIDSFVKRAAAIAANNAFVCGIAVVAGAVWPLAWIAVAAIGFSLGLALRRMAPAQYRVDISEDLDPAAGGDRVDEPVADAELANGATWWPVVEGLGLALNLLELPAIALSAGLSLSQGAWVNRLTLGAALRQYATIVLPLLIVAALGEALWLHYQPRRRALLSPGNGD